jgi:hypothetical protein
MLQTGCCKGIGKAKAKMSTSDKDEHLSLDWDRMNCFILGHIRGFIPIYNVCSRNAARPSDILYDKIFLDAVMTGHFS